MRGKSPKGSKERSSKLADFRLDPVSIFQKVFVRLPFVPAIYGSVGPYLCKHFQSNIRAYRTGIIDGYLPPSILVCKIDFFAAKELFAV